MPEILIVILTALAAGGAAVGGSFYTFRKITKKIEQSQPPVPEKREDPRIGRTLEQARGDANRIRREAEEDARKIRNEARSHEQKTREVEASIDRKLGAIEEREKALDKKFDDLTGKTEDVEKIKQEQLAKLERVAGLGRDEARKIIMDGLENRLKEDIAKRIKHAEYHAKEIADDKAPRVIVDANE